MSDETPIRTWLRVALVVGGTVVLTGRADVGYLVPIVLVACVVVLTATLVPASREWARKALGFVPAAIGLLVPGALLPVGHEGDTTVRRRPWVSYGIMALCLLAFQVQILARPSEEQQAAFVRDWIDMETYWLQHPYLGVSRFLGERLDNDMIQQVLKAREDSERAGGRPSAETVEREQATLDTKVAAVEAWIRQDFDYRFGRVPERRDALSFVTSMFLHVGWLHLLGNLLFFYLTGPFIEDVFGRLLFAFLYLGSGMAGGLLTLVHDPERTIPSIGASGAIAGVMGAFLIRYAARRVRLQYAPALWLPILRFQFSLPAWVLLPLWFLENVWCAHEGYRGVGWWAHIGGFLFGVAFALVVRRTRVEERVITPAVERETTLRRLALERAIESRVSGQITAAKAAIRAALAAAPTHLDTWEEAYEIALAAGDRDEAARCITRVVELYSRGHAPHTVDEIQAVEDTIAGALERVGGALTPAFYLTAGGYLEERLQSPLALHVYQLLAERHPDDPSSARALFRQARILERLAEPDAAREKLRAARDHAACGGALRETIGARLAHP